MCVTGCATAGSMCATGTGWPKCPSTQTNHPCHGTPNHNVTILPLPVQSWQTMLHTICSNMYQPPVLQCQAHAVSTSATPVYIQHILYVRIIYSIVAKVEMAPRCVMSKNLCHCYWPTLPSLNIDHPKDDRDVNDVKDQEDAMLLRDVHDFSTSRLPCSHNAMMHISCYVEQIKPIWTMQHMWHMTQSSQT